MIRPFKIKDFLLKILDLNVLERLEKKVTGMARLNHLMQQAGLSGFNLVASVWLVRLFVQGVCLRKLLRLSILK